MNFAILTDHKVKIKESQELRPFQKTKKDVEHVGDSDTSCNWPTWNGLQSLGKRTWKVGNNRMNLDYPHYSIVEAGQNTESSQ